MEQFSNSKKGIKFLNTLYHKYEIRYSDIIDNIDIDEIPLFVKCLDENAQDWSITEELFRYFTNVMLQFDEEDDDKLKSETKKLITQIYNKFIDSKVAKNNGITT